MGIFSNELADKLAKKSLLQKPRPKDITTSIGYLRRLIKAKSPIE
jgi:hypothetical protein